MSGLAVPDCGDASPLSLVLLPWSCADLRETARAVKHHRSPEQPDQVLLPCRSKRGVAVVDLRHGQVMALLEFQTAVEEIFDVQLLPGLRFPEVIGFQHETIQHTFVIPPVRGGGSTGSEEELTATVG